MNLQDKQNYYESNLNFSLSSLIMNDENSLNKFIAVNLIKNMINQLINYKYSDERKSKYKAHDAIVRIVRFENFTFKLKVERYKDKTTNKLHTFYPDYLNFGSSICGDEKERIQNYAVKDRITYSRLASKYNVSKTQIYKIVKQINLDKINSLKNYKNELVNNNIFIGIDDTFINSNQGRTKQKLKIRFLTIYQLKNNKIVNLNKIMNILPSSKMISSKCLSKTIKEAITKNYGDYNSFNVYILGDGAHWIQTLAKQLKGNFILCKFHFLRKFNDFIFKKRNRGFNNFIDSIQNLSGWKIEKEISEAYNSRDYGKLLDILNTIYLYFRDSFILSDIDRYNLNSLIRYTSKLESGIINNDYSSLIEGHISVYIKRKLNKSFALYSQKTIEALLLNDNKIQNTLIQTYY